MKPMKRMLLPALLVALSFGPVALAMKNGIDIPASKYPAIRLLSFKDGSMCTGTFIGPNALLTAAHCLEFGDFTVGGKSPSEKRAHPEFMDGKERNHSYDVALVRFADPFVYAKLSSARPLAKDSVDLVGYGQLERSDRASAGVKREGFSSIYGIIEGQIVISSSRESFEPMPLVGDSGGPMLNTKHEVVGVLSKVANGTGGTNSFAEYVDVTNPDIRSWLSSVAAKLQLEIPSL